MTNPFSVPVEFDGMTRKLLEIDVQRMATLAKKWGCIPQTLLEFRRVLFRSHPVLDQRSLLKFGPLWALMGLNSPAQIPHSVFLSSP